ncbi:MAG TPA: 4Fe-4S binding protein [Terracidiphilus sp.]|nr:4Fe-4S binding protein [Terracidiphilus sp.]
MLTLSVPADETSSTEKTPAKQKKPLVRRTSPDRSQQVRRAVQFAFLLLNAIIGIQFLLWVRYFESQGHSHYFERPAGVDGWLPIAGLMNLRYLLVTRNLPEIHPSAMVLVCVFLLSSLLIKKSFCSWLCPVGTVSEYLWKLGRKLFRRNITVPRWIDIPLRSLKYLLLAFFLYIILTMSAQELGDFLVSPFGIVADVKMLNFFRYLGTIGIIVIATFIVLSVVIQNFWCRFLCPYGALMGIVSVLSPVKIRRDAQACIDCGKCNKACPSHLSVDSLIQIRSVECTGCMECIAVCPAENALQFSLPPRTALTPDAPPIEAAAARWQHRALQPRMVAAVLALVFFGLIGAARATGHWQTNIPREIYMQLVPNAENFDH